MRYPLLSRIRRPGDVKKLLPEELPVLCDEIRSFLIESVSATGGHLSSNLGVVELTVALHRALRLPQDKIVFDVGHQCYTHKLLTGRRAGFAQLRQKDGISGFPTRPKATATRLLPATAAPRCRLPSHCPRQKDQGGAGQGGGHHRRRRVHRRYGLRGHE